MNIWLPQFKGQQVAAIHGGPASAPLDGLSGVTAAWSMGRKLLTAYGGAFYVESAGEVTTINDQNGALNLTRSGGINGPALSTAGANSRACADFDGVNDTLQHVTLTNFINADAGYIIVSAIVDAITTNAANVYDNDAIWADGGGYAGFHLKTAPEGRGYNFDTTQDSTTHAAFPTADEVVVEWRHEGGNLLTRINMGTWETTPSGNTGVLTGALFLMRTPLSTPFCEGKIFEMATFDAVPIEATRDTLAANFMAWIGA